MRYLMLTFLFTLSSVVFAQKADIGLLKSIAFSESKDYTAALESLESANPNHPLYVRLKADCFYRLNRLEEALHIYLNINKISKEEFTLEIARIYALKDNKEEAFTWLTKYLNNKNKINEYAIVSDKAFEGLVDTKEWKNLWKKDWYSHAEIQRNAVTAILREGNSQTALDELEKDQSRAVPKHEYYAFQAKALFQLKQLEPALKAINLSLELHKLNETYWITRGDIYFEVAEYAKAVADYSRALNQNPYIIPLYLKRAEAARLSDNTSQAAEDMDIYQQLYPKAPQTIYLLGKLEAAQENFSVSLAYFNKLISQDKSNPSYYIERGLVELKIEDYQAADEDFGMALDLNPNLTEAYLNKGKIRIYTMDNESACFNLEKARSLGSAEAAKLYNEHCTK